MTHLTLFFLAFDAICQKKSGHTVREGGGGGFVPDDKLYKLYNLSLNPELVCTGT